MPWPLVIYRVNSWMNWMKLSIGKTKLVLGSFTESLMKITTKYDSGPQELYHAHESFPSSPSPPCSIGAFYPNSKETSHDRQFLVNVMINPPEFNRFPHDRPPRVRVKLTVSNGSLGSDHDTIVKVRRSLTCQLLDRLFPAGTEWGWLSRLNCAGLCLN